MHNLLWIAVDKWITARLHRAISSLNSSYVQSIPGKPQQTGVFPTLIPSPSLGSFSRVRAREAKVVPGPRLGKCEAQESPKLLGLLRGISEPHRVADRSRHPTSGRDPLQDTATTSDQVGSWRLATGTRRAPRYPSTALAVGRRSLPRRSVRNDGPRRPRIEWRLLGHR